MKKSDENKDSEGGGLSRRAFLAISGATILSGRSELSIDTANPICSPLGSDLIVQPHLATTLAARSVEHQAPWYARMRRCVQINFNERDPIDMDVEAWADYWVSLRVDAVLLNGGGIVAFYPTEVPYHQRSRFLGTRDLFGEMLNAMKRRGLRVVARMDCNLAYEQALAARPEWFERNPDGSPRKHNESPWLFRTCMFSSYFTEQMPAIYREINNRYKVDGFFTNGWPSTGSLGVCYCQNCRKLYEEKIGGTPPEQTDATSPLYRRYYNAQMARILEIWELWNKVAREDGRESIYVGNLGGGIRTVKSVKKLAEVAGWFNADHQGRSGDTFIWDCAQQGRVAQSVMKSRTITNVTGAYSNSQPVWRHVSKPAAETTMWLAQTAASGVVPWFHWLGGSPEDNRWRDTGRAFYKWLADNEVHFRNKRSIADIAVLYPQATIAFYKSGDGPGSWRGTQRSQTSDYLQGLYHALVDGRFLFDLVHQEDLASETLGRYRALLIPNAAFLSDEQCEQIRRYAESGGSILATFETSLYNEWGDRRARPGLGDLFGIDVIGETIGPYGNSYMRIEQRTEVTAGFDGTSLIPGPENRVPIKADDRYRPLLTVVPYYPAFPPEMVYPRNQYTSEPAAIFKTTGSSRVAYYAGDIERTLWRSGTPDLSLLIQNTVRWLAGAAPPVSVRGDGIVELFGWETEAGYTLHMLNYTNPNMTRGFFRRFYPVGPQAVSMSVGAGMRINRVRALRGGRDLAFKQDRTTVRFEVPSVADYEVIALT